MGAFRSRLTATTTCEAFMPTVCWMHPLIPKAIYSLGRTTTPVCPTWCSYPIHPASTALREAPSDAPISFARCASFANPASPPIPFPPATMICAFCKGTASSTGRKPVRRIFDRGVDTVRCRTGSPAASCGAGGCSNTPGRTLAIWGR